MARLNIEEGAISDSRLDFVAQATGFDKWSILGRLCHLWHETQSEFQTKITAQKLYRLMLVASPKHCASILGALIDAPYITLIEKNQDGDSRLDVYEIHGNQTQIDAMKRRGIKARGAAKKRWGYENAPSISNTNTNSNTNSNPEKEYTFGERSVRPVCDSPKIEVQLDRTDYQGFVAVWNQNRGSLPACAKLSKGRKKKIKCRLAEEPDLNYWAGCVRKLSDSEFCRNGAWANIDWLVSNDTNHVKATEGKYDNRDKSSSVPKINMDLVFNRTQKGVQQ